jgi:antitoxin component YwqK of YwqJK toxin-antitoxin module
LDYFRDGLAAQVTHFHPNGNIRATGFYLDRLRDSTWEIFNTEGILIERVNYFENMRHGLSEMFDRNGNLTRSAEYYRNQLNGRWWERTANGGEQWTTYRQNLSHGLYEAIYADGTISISGHNEMGLKEGNWYFYHESALLDRIMVFRNNILQRRLVAINVNGKDILINTDSVAFMHTNGTIVEIKMIDNIIYRPAQTFAQLTRSIGTDDFFLATERLLAPFIMVDSLVMVEDEELDFSARLRAATHFEIDEELTLAEQKRAQQRALLILRIPPPYDVYVDGDIIGLIQGLTSSQRITEER